MPFCSALPHRGGQTRVTNSSAPFAPVSASRAVMSFCSFQAQLVSVMELLAKAAAAEIRRRVDDSCAGMKVELRRSRKDIDALKRKCVMMENELKRVKGRGRRRVWISGASERFSTPLRTECAREADVIRSQDENPEEIHNLQQDGQVLGDGLGGPVIKEERGEEELGGRERDAVNVPFDHEEQNLQRVQPQENTEGQNALFGDPEVQRPCFIDTQTCTEPSERVKLDEDRLGLQIKAEKNTEEEERFETEAFEASVGPRDHLRYPLWPPAPEPTHESQRENAGRTFSTSQHLQTTTIFSPPDVTEPPRNNLHLVERTQMELHRSGPVTAEDQSRPAWCGESAQEPAHVTSAGAVYPHQQRGTLNVPTNAFPPHGALDVAHRLRTHWRSNADVVKRFSCSFCEKCFNRFSQLKEHLRCHTGEKPFTCAQCGRSFTKHCNLIRHAVVHSGEKPYQCARCGRSFTQRSSLKSHERTHTGEWDTAHR